MARCWVLCTVRHFVHVNLEVACGLLAPAVACPLSTLHPGLPNSDRASPCPTPTVRRSGRLLVGLMAAGATPQIYTTGLVGASPRRL